MGISRLGPTDLSQPRRQHRIRIDGPTVTVGVTTMPTERFLEGMRLTARKQFGRRSRQAKDLTRALRDYRLRVKRGQLAR
jgi:hypothetical protein